MIPHVAEMSVCCEPLPGGDELVTSAGPAFGLVTVRAVFSEGATLDGPIGGATLAAWEMLDRGTRRRGRAGFHSAIDRIGAHFGLATHRTSVMVEMVVLGEYLETALDLFAEALLEPADDREELVSLLEEVAEAVECELEEASGVAARLLGPVLWPAGSWGVPIDGTRRSRSCIDLDVVRDRRERLLARPALLGVASDDPFATRPAVLRFWERVRRAHPVRRGVGPTRPEPTWGRGSVVDLAESAQGALIVTSDAPPSSVEQWPAIVLHAAAFGGGFASPLVGRLRSREGLSYDVSWTVVPGRWGSLQHFRVHPPGDRVPYALAAARQCWERSAAELLAPEVLEGCKAYVIGNHLAALETVGQRLSAALWLRTMEQPARRLWELPARIAEVEPAAVAAVVETHGWTTGRRSLAAAHSGGATDAGWRRLASDWDIAPRPLSSLR